MDVVESSRGRRWRRIAVYIGAWIALRIAVVVLFRRHSPKALAVVRRFNRRWLNPVMLRLAGRPHWYAARLRHVGRRSGRTHVTPVVARPVAPGFAVPLPYGTEVDWLRNLQAAGHGELTVRGERYTVRAPRVVSTAEIAAQLSPMYRLVSRVYAISAWLIVDAVPMGRALLEVEEAGAEVRQAQASEAG